MSVKVAKVFGHRIKANDAEGGRVWLTSESISENSSSEDLVIWLKPYTPFEKAQELASLLNGLYDSVEIQK